MKKTYVLCEYCNHAWTESLFDLERDDCAVCGDRNLKRREVEAMDAFGYDVKGPEPRKKITEKWRKKNSRS